MTSHYQQAGPSSSYYIEQQPQAPQNHGAEYNNTTPPGPPIRTAITLSSTSISIHSNTTRGRGRGCRRRG
jgi:hypothetical protein